MDKITEFSELLDAALLRTRRFMESTGEHYRMDRLKKVYDFSQCAAVKGSFWVDAKGRATPAPPLGVLCMKWTSEQGQFVAGGVWGLASLGPGGGWSWSGVVSHGGELYGGFLDLGLTVREDAELKKAAENLFSKGKK